MSQPFMNWQTEPLPSVNSEATPSASSSPQPSSPTNCSRQEGQLFPAKLLAMINDDSLSISFKDGCIFVPDCSRLGAQAASWSAEYAAQHGRGSGSLASYRTLERAMNDYGIRLVRDKQWLEERGVKKGVGQMRIHPFLCEEAINLDLVTKSNKFYFAHSRDRYIDIARSVLQVSRNKPTGPEVLEWAAFMRQHPTLPPPGEIDAAMEAHIRSKHSPTIDALRAVTPVPQTGTLLPVAAMPATMSTAFQPQSQMPSSLLRSGSAVQYGAASSLPIHPPPTHPPPTHLLHTHPLLTHLLLTHPAMQYHPTSPLMAPMPRQPPPINTTYVPLTRMLENSTPGPHRVPPLLPERHNQVAAGNTTQPITSAVGSTLDTLGSPSPLVGSLGSPLLPRLDPGVLATMNMHAASMHTASMHTTAVATATAATTSHTSFGPLGPLNSLSPLSPLHMAIPPSTAAAYNSAGSVSIPAAHDPAPPSALPQILLAGNIFSLPSTIPLTSAPLTSAPLNDFSAFSAPNAFNFPL